MEGVTDSRGEENGSRWRDREEYETEGTKWVDGDVIKNKTCPEPGIKKRKYAGSYVAGIENVSVEET